MPEITVNQFLPHFSPRMSGRAPYAHIEAHISTCDGTRMKAFEQARESRLQHFRDKLAAVYAELADSEEAKTSSRLRQARVAEARKQMLAEVNAAEQEKVQDFAALLFQAGAAVAVERAARDFIQSDGFTTPPRP